jgi:hypothetical protein
MQVSDRFPDRVGPLIRQDGRVKSVDPDTKSVTTTVLTATTGGQKIIFGRAIPSAKLA